MGDIALSHDDLSITKLRSDPHMCVCQYTRHYAAGAGNSSHASKPKDGRLDGVEEATRAGEEEVANRAVAKVKLVQYMRRGKVGGKRQEGE